jgi:hypothetical protein
MAENHRIKTKIGDHEFEAEGTPEFVQEQFRIFKEMVDSAPKNPQNVLPPATRSSTMAEVKPSTDNVEASLRKIMTFDEAERIVSLTVRPPTAEDAVLLILFGQKEMLGHESVTGGTIMEGITSTGGLQVARVDRLLEKLGKDGDVIVLGQHRSKTYRLTNSGLNRAREIASAMLFLVP